MTRTLEVARERWPLRAAFTISRGSKTASEVVVARVRDGELEGQGECLPYARYGETPDGVAAAIEALAPAVREGMGRAELQHALPAGAARNALDCALWDLECKTKGLRAWEIAGLAAPGPLTTAYTLSLDTPEAMRAAAARNAGRPLLKLKLGGPGDLDRVAAVREGAPEARLIVDANEGWTPEDYKVLAPELGPSRSGDDRAAPTRRRRRGPRAPGPARPGLRGRGLPRPCDPGRTRRTLRRGQHQARQDRGDSPRRSRFAMPRASGASRSWWVA